MKPRRATLMLAATALVAAACGSETAASTSSQPTATDQTTSTQVQATSVATTTTAPTTTTTAALTTTAATTVSNADCAVGTWELDSQNFLEQILLATRATEAAGLDISHGGGSYIIDLDADGTMTGTRDDWQMRFESPEGVFVNTLDGTETGTWSTDGDTLSITTDVADVTVSAAVEVDGEMQALPFGGQQQVRTDVFSGSGTYTCSGDEMAVTFEGVTSNLDRR